MKAIADETLAFSVSESTMQDWLAAVMLAKHEPTPAYAPRNQPSHPVRLLELPKPARRCVVPPAPVAPIGVAGARTVYWLSLAAALALTLVF
jgi:hypothetical protein